MQQAEKLRNEALGQTLVQNMQRRGFDAYYCADKEAALAKALELIPETDVVSWGGSVTLAETGVLDAVKDGTLTEQRIDESVTRIVTVKVHM